MSTDEKKGRAPPAIDLQSVLEVSQRQVREDLRALDALGPLDRLRELQEWLDLSRLRHGARGDDRFLRILLGNLPERFRPSERERNEALERLANRWARRWRRFNRNVHMAAIQVAEREGTPPNRVKRQALQTGILLALRDAQQPQVTRIGRDRAMSFGSRIRLLQKKDLESLAENEVSERLVKKLSGRPAGLRIFEPYQLLSPIEAVLRFGVDVEQVRPVDLRPSLFQKWTFTRAIKHAEDWLLEEVGLDDPAPHVDAREVEVIEADSDEPEQLGRDTERASELDLLEVLNQAGPDPLRRILDRERVAEVLEAATPSQREIVDLLDEFHVRMGLPRAEAIKAIARERNVTVNAVHQALRRLAGRIPD